MTKLQGPLALRNNISWAWKKWVHALAAQNLGPKSIAELMIHSRFLFVRFGMPGMPIVKPVWFGMPGMLGMNLACPATIS